jgi:hypothetical protein
MIALPNQDDVLVPMTDPHYSRLLQYGWQDGEVAGLSLVAISIQFEFQGFLVGILQIPLTRAMRRSGLEAKQIEMA